MTKRNATRLVEWRGGEMEFAELGFEHLAKPPWYVVRYRGAYWNGRRWNYWWIDYLGVPHVYLTLKRARVRAKEFKKQYGDKEWETPLEVEVVRVGPLRSR